MASFTSDNIIDGSFTEDNSKPGFPNAVVNILHCIGSENELSSCSMDSPKSSNQTGMNFGIAKVSCSGK